MDNQKYAYSLNEHEGPWREDIPSVLDDLRLDETFYASIGDAVTIFRGERTSFTHGDFASFIGVTIQEHFQEAAYDEGSEHSEDYLDDMTPDHRNDLEKMVVAFLDRHCAQPTFWTVDSVEPYTITWPGEV